MWHNALCCAVLCKNCACICCKSCASCCIAGILPSTELCRLLRKHDTRNVCNPRGFMWLHMHCKMSCSMNGIAVADNAMYGTPGQLSPMLPSSLPASQATECPQHSGTRACTNCLRKDISTVGLTALQCASAGHANMLLGAEGWGPCLKSRPGHMQCASSSTTRKSRPRCAMCVSHLLG